MIQNHNGGLRSCAALLLVMALAGCATGPSISRSAHLNVAGEAGRCADFFLNLDQLTAAAGSLDAGEERIEGYPYLRINRLLVSFQDDVSKTPAFNAWLDRLQTLDSTARVFEIANLPDHSWQTTLPGMDRAALNRQVRNCGDLLKALDFRDPAQRQALSHRVRVADEYHWWPRILGLYPLSSLLVAQGVRNWHADARKAYSTTPPQGWRSMRYTYSGPRPTHLDLQAMLRRTPRDALGFPRYPDAVLKALYARYAPVWVVRNQSEDDRIGAPYWRRPGESAVQTRRPVTYTRLSFTRFRGQLLTQLNYIIWFPARTAQHWLDIYAGSFDGVNLRITLGANGTPLLFETVHNCGCYYKAFPTRRLRVLDAIDYREPPLVLPAPDLDPTTQTLTVAMQSASHYVQHLYPDPKANADTNPDSKTTTTLDYSLHDYADLRSLNDGAGGRDSLFNMLGTVTASDRPERYILWPTGVYSPGAMRQWGRHPVAFVGERHFDDPDYMGKMFAHSSCMSSGTC